jgi:hypothetical protein
MPRRNIIQLTLGVLLIVGSIVAQWQFEVFSSLRVESAYDMIGLSLPAFGFLIGIWLLAASFVYPKPQK